MSFMIILSIILLLLSIACFFKGLKWTGAWLFVAKILQLIYICLLPNNWFIYLAIPILIGVFLSFALKPVGSKGPAFSFRKDLFVISLSCYIIGLICVFHLTIPVFLVLIIWALLMISFSKFWKQPFSLDALALFVAIVLSVLQFIITAMGWSYHLVVAVNIIYYIFLTFLLLLIWKIPHFVSEGNELQSEEDVPSEEFSKWQKNEQ